MLAEPPPTQADLHFRVAGFPVRIHPLFWLIALLLGLSAFGGEPKGTLLSIAVVFVSILVHELGHAFVQRGFGGRPRIVLHGFGGLAICGDCHRSTRSQILISLAGPAAGFLLAAIVAAVVVLSSDQARFVPFWAQPSARAAGMNSVWLLIGTFSFAAYPSWLLTVAVWLMLWINVVWGLVNLLPVYPLDGGQVAREAMLVAIGPRDGIVRSLQLSMGVAIAAAVWALVGFGLLFAAILFGYLAYTNYRTLQAYTGRGPGMGWG